MNSGKICLTLFFVAVLAIGVSDRKKSSGGSAHAALHLHDFTVVTPQEIRRGPPAKRQIALTFDAGSEADSFPELLGVLDRMQVKATFFLTGKWLVRYPQHAERLKISTHAIGNHSWAHPAYTGLSDAAMRSDLLAADTALSEFFGVSIRPLFRPPFGDRDKRVLRILGENGYLSVYWTLDTLDAMEPRKSSGFIARRVIAQTDEALDGAIILAHVGYPETCAAMPVIISNLQTRGFVFVTLSEWLEPELRD